MDSGKIIAAGAKHPHAPVTHYLHKFAFANSEIRMLLDQIRRGY